jgi:hypothetical protein
MSTTDPLGRREPGGPAEQSNMEYLKGMASAPMGWPAAPSDQTPLDPRELEALLKRTPVHESPERPWYARPSSYVVLVLFALLVAGILSLL